MQFLKNITVSSFLVLVDQVIYSGSNFALTFWLARRLSISDFGKFSLVVLITYFMLNVSTAILIQPYQIVISKKPVAEEMGFVLKILAVSIIVLGSLFGGMYFFITHNLLPFLSNFNTIENIAMLPDVFIFIGGYLFQDFFRRTLLANQEIKKVVFIDTLFLLVFVFLFYFHNSLSFILLAIGFSNFFSALPGVAYFLKRANFKVNHSYYLQYHLKHGKWLLSTALLQWFSGNFVVFVSGIYVGLEALGALRLVQSFFGILNVVLQTVENFLLPKIAQMYFKNKEKAYDYLAQVSKRGGIIFGVILVFVFVFANTIIATLGGEDYRKYGYVVRLVAVLYCVIFYGYSWRIKVRVQERNRLFFMGYVLATLFTLISFHFLLKFFTLYGVVFILICSQLISVFYWKYQLNPKKKIRWI